MKLLSGMFGLGHAPSTYQRRRSRRRELEVLENRTMPSYVVSLGVLQINGTSLRDEIRVERIGDDIFVTERNGPSPPITSPPIPVGTGPGEVSVGIDIDTKAEDDLIIVESVGEGSPGSALQVEILGGDGDDRIEFSPMAKNLGAVSTSLTINGGPGDDHAIVYDENNEITRVDAIRASGADNVLVRQNAPAITFTSVVDLELHASGFAENLDVESTADGTHVFLHLSAYTRQTNIGGNVNTLASIAGDISIFGHGSQNQLNFNDQFNQAGGKYELGVSSVTRVAPGVWATIYYRDVGTVTFNASGSRDEFTVGSSVSKDIIIHGNNGDDELYGADSYRTVFNLTGANRGNLYNKVFFDSFQKIYGGDKADSFVLTPGQTFAGAIYGGVGVDFLVYAAFNFGVKVNLNINLIVGATTVSEVEGIIGTSHNDKLTGNSDNNVLIGGGGSDTLGGEDGRDLLIGGPGTDVLDGGAGDDILIGGTTSYDTNPLGLAEIIAKWSLTGPTHDYRTRIDSLRDPGFRYRLVAVSPLNDAGIVDDGADDRLTGGADSDWFFGNPAEITDRLTTPKFTEELG